jgi:hypothetical protein
MGKKLLVALALEGKLQAEGLQSIDDDGDLLTAMARELVNRQGVGEEAAAVWKALQAQLDEPAAVGETAQSDNATSAASAFVEQEPPEEGWVWSNQPAGPMEQLSLF